MNVGSYRGAAALTAYEQWQEVTSQNIAAGSVPGFKKTEVSFACAEAGKSKVGSGSGTGEEVRGVMPQLSSKITFGQGELNKTGNNLDFAIQGKGFFQVRSPSGEMAYTRNGEFHLNSSGGLTTKEGYPVMGANGPLSLEGGSGPVTINADGVIQQGAQPVGKLAVYDASDPQKLVKLNGGLYGADPAAPLSRMATPTVVSGSLESSNVAPIREMVNLITVSRAYEANQKVIQTDDDNTDKAIQALGNA
jgi:flagellar basal body rod protein FlgG